MVEFSVVPSKMALINVDMQNRFVENSPVAAPDGLIVLERINELIVVCREAGVLIVHAAHIIRADYANLGVLGEFAPSVKEGSLKKNSPGAELHSRLNIDDSDIQLDKPRFGAFHGTELELILRSRNVDTVIISGIATNVCCDTTAREANARDFRVFFMQDGTATFGIDDIPPQTIQHVTCATLGKLFAQVVSVSEMITKLQNASNTRQTAV